MRLPLMVASAIWLGASTLSWAQPAQPAPAAPQAEQDDEDDDRTAATGAKRASCRQGGLSQGLKGPELSDHVVICMAEVRLTCTRDAVTQKIRGKEREQFIRQCITN